MRAGGEVVKDGENQATSLLSSLTVSSSPHSPLAGRPVDFARLICLPDSENEKE